MHKIKHGYSRLKVYRALQDAKIVAIIKVIQSMKDMVLRVFTYLKNFLTIQKHGASI